MQSLGLNYLNFEGYGVLPAKMLEFEFKALSCIISKQYFPPLQPTIRTVTIGYCDWRNHLSVKSFTLQFGLLG